MGRDAEKDLAMCDQANDGLYAEGWLVYTEYANSADDSGLVARCNSQELATFLVEAREALPYWINRAQAEEAEIERLKAENVRGVAASGPVYEKLLEALREIDTHIRETDDPVPYIVATLKQALPEYKGWDDASRT